MQQTMRKIKRVQPLVKMKKTKVDEESAVLQAIRQEKVTVVSQMKENQRRYMEGVERMNQLRTSRTRDNLTTMEQAVDHVKAEWYRLYKRVQDIETKEKLQIGQLLTAERDLKAVEKLQEKYQLEYRKEASQSEQKQLDEIAIRNFTSS
jgi:flagellar export protein FliJ